ncbi:hypothetical protein [[Mycoplasma] collis]|uniref:hypothetical protein n=1 Tax=[Mycoplasma] collis TaxID=2127 RepID=UPI000A9A37CB|nr:hypothetical protein [[Mycoplasma] collis]
MEPENGSTTSSYSARALDSIYNFFNFINTLTLTSNVEKLNILKTKISSYFNNFIEITEKIDPDPSPVGALTFEFNDYF